MLSIPENKQLILFDGVCNLCNSSVQYVIKHDKKNLFVFAAFQSDIGKDLVDNYNIDISKVDSIILLNTKKELSFKSSAALKIAYHLGFPNNILSIFLIVPAFVRNWIYGYIAKNRYKWFGKRKTCMVPSPELGSKFL